MLFRVPAMIAVFGLGVLSYATTYYVGTSGTDAPANGTSGSPWESLAYACGQVAANQGHIIHLGTGTFAETSTCLLKTGVGVQGDGFDKSILKSSLDGSLINIQSSTLVTGNQTLSDFAIDGNNGQLASGINVSNVNGVVITRVSISYTQNNAIHAQGSDANPIGIEISNSTFLNAAADHADWSEGVIFGGNTKNALIHDNTINSSRGYGIKFTEGIANAGIRIYNNIVNVTGSNATWGFNFPIEIWNMTNACRLYNNSINGTMSLVGGQKGDSTKALYVYGNTYICPTGRENWGIELGDIGDVDVYENYFENCDRGIMIDFQISNARIFKNVFYNMFNGDEMACALYCLESSAATNTQFVNNVVDGSAFAGVLLHGESGGVYTQTKIQNNVFKNVGTVLMFLVKSGATAQGTVLSYNIKQNCKTDVDFWDGNQSNVSGTTNANNLTGVPGLTESGAKPSPYYQPKSATSLVVNAGVNVGLPYSGSAPDIGAYEYVATSIAPHAPLHVAPSLYRGLFAGSSRWDIAGRRIQLPLTSTGVFVNKRISGQAVIHFTNFSAPQ